MRSIRWLAAVTGTLALVTACGGGSGVGPNSPPVANFTAPACIVGVACAFTDASTDDNGITAREWNFGDNTAVSVDANPTHIFAAAIIYQVSLKVTDAAGETNTKTNPVTVTANQSPVASFVLPTCTAGTPCGFHSTSTDADGTIASTQWTFGDGGTGDTPDATHTYAAAGTFTVELIVTDDKGATSAPVTRQLTVTPAASQSCTTTGTFVDCSLGITQQGTVKITIVSEACELSGNKLTINIPGQPEQTAFFDLCNRLVGQEYIVKDGAGAPLVFQAGTTLPLRFHQGPQGTNPPVSDPGIRVSGSYPNLSLNIDDGGAAGTPGEPDFNDVVLSVQRN